MSVIRAIPLSAWEEVVTECESRGVKVPSGPVVYFIEGIATGLVKIGKSKQLWKRYVQLRDSSPSKLKILKVLPGYGDEELWAHALFADARARGEWFHVEMIRDRIMGLERLGKASRVGPDARVVVLGSCGHEKSTTVRHRRKAESKPCVSCGQLARFEAMGEAEREEELSAARKALKFRRELNEGGMRRDAYERRALARCGCGGPLFDGAAITRSSFKRKMCPACCRKKQAMGGRNSAGKPRRRAAASAT